MYNCFFLFTVKFIYQIGCKKTPQILKLWGFKLFWQSPSISHGTLIYQRTFIMKINPTKNFFVREFAIKDKTSYKKKVTCKCNM